MRVVLRIASIALVGAAFFLSRETVHDRVLLILLQGAPMAELRLLAQAGHLPVLEAAIAGGVGGEISTAQEIRSTDAVMQVLLTVSWTDSDAARPAKPIWSALGDQGRRYVLVGVSDTEFSDDGERVVLPGGDVRKGFVATNTGVVANRRTIGRGNAPWPYSAVGTELENVVAALQRGQVSPWIEWRDVSADSRSGVFNVHLLDRDTLYLSPVYTRYRALPELEGSIYVADDPSRVVASSRASEYLPTHVNELQAVRARAAVVLAASRNYDLFVYVDRRLASTARKKHEVASFEDLSTATIEAYRQIDESVGQLLDNAGDRTAVLVINLEDFVSGAGAGLGWYTAPRVVGDLHSWGPVRAEELAATISYLLGFGSGPARQPVPAITTRFPLRSRARASRAPDRGAEKGAPATAAALEKAIGDSAGS